MNMNNEVDDDHNHMIKDASMTHDQERSQIHFKWGAEMYWGSSMENCSIWERFPKPVK